MRFLQLELYCSNLENQLQFYREALKLKTDLKSENRFEVHLKSGNLGFCQSDQFVPYHFAINIPSYSEKMAKNWLEGRVELLPFAGDPIINFENWNAKSLYFYDADLNIVELIARRNLNHAAIHSFSSDELIEISEIGLAVDSIEPIFKILNESLGLQIFDGNFDQFCAIGEEKTLFITVDKNRKKWFPTDTPSMPSPFKVLLESEYSLYWISYDSTNLRIVRVEKG